MMFQSLLNVNMQKLLVLQNPPSPFYTVMEVSCHRMQLNITFQIPLQQGPFTLVSPFTKRLNSGQWDVCKSNA